jgi:aminoglycoside 2'-N-acetyltransferase I
VNGFVDEAYALGGLCTGSHRFYRRLGWEVWVGPTYMRAPGGNERTADEDGNVLVRWTPTTPRDLDPTAPLICEYRSGDAW